MPKFSNLVGRRFGRLTVIKHIGKTKSKKQLWECICDCGKPHNADSNVLTSGNTVSCGCYLKERITKHGGTGKGSYNTWRAMMRRCYNQHDKDYPRYGGNGVSVCNKWHDYVAFVAHMGEPVGAQTLDRIDPYGNYTPENCRWASLKTQARNVRSRPNKSGYRGVYLLKHEKWLAAITVNKKKYYGVVRESLDAALADRKELERIHWSSC